MAHAQGKTREEALENLKEVLKLLAECAQAEALESGFQSTDRLAFA